MYLLAYTRQPNASVEVIHADTLPLAWQVACVLTAFELPLDH